MKTRLVPLLLILVLFTAACGSKSDKNKTAASDTSTSTSVGDVTSTSTAAVAGVTTTVKGAASATTVKGATVTTLKATSSNGAPAPATPGTYDYAQSGSSTIGSIPANAATKVDAANAAGVQVVHDYQDPAGPPVSDTTIAYRADGPFITQTVQRAAGMTITCNFDAPVAAPPWPATDGKKITGHANCGAITADVNGSITGHKKVTLNGASIDVIVASVTITTHGQIESTSTQEQWWAPSLRLPTHTHTVTNGRYGALSFNSDVTADLKSGVPH